LEFRQPGLSFRKTPIALDLKLTQRSNLSQIVL